MKTPYLNAASVLTLVSFGISGCASTPDGRKTQAQGTGIGAAGGAAAGALFGYLAGGGRGAAAGAITGAAIGGVQGYWWGTAVAERKRRYANAEAWLDEEIKHARKANARAVEYNQRLKARLAKIEAEARAAKAANDQSKLKKLKSEVASIQTETSKEVKDTAQYEKDQPKVLGDSSAKASPNYSEYRSTSQAWGNAKAERSQLIDRTASLNRTIGG